MKGLMTLEYMWGGGLVAAFVYVVCLLFLRRLVRVHVLICALELHFGCVKLLQVLSRYTRLAQSVERWPFKPVVVGSSPTGGACFFAIGCCHGSERLVRAFDSCESLLHPLCVVWQHSWLCFMLRIVLFASFTLRMSAIFKDSHATYPHYCIGGVKIVLRRPGGLDTCSGPGAAGGKGGH